MQEGRVRAALLAQRDTIPYHARTWSTRLVPSPLNRHHANAPILHKWDIPQNRHEQTTHKTRFDKQVPRGGPRADPTPASNPLDPPKTPPHTLRTQTGARFVALAPVPLRHTGTAGSSVSHDGCALDPPTSPAAPAASPRPRSKRRRGPEPVGRTRPDDDGPGNERSRRRLAAFLERLDASTASPRDREPRSADAKGVAGARGAMPGSRGSTRRVWTLSPSPRRAGVGRTRRWLRVIREFIYSVVHESK